MAILSALHNATRTDVSFALLALLLTCQLVNINARPNICLGMLIESFQEDKRVTLIITLSLSIQFRGGCLVDTAYCLTVYLNLNCKKLLNTVKIKSSPHHFWIVCHPSNFEVVQNELQRRNLCSHFICLQIRIPRIGSRIRGALQAPSIISRVNFCLSMPFLQESLSGRGGEG